MISYLVEVGIDMSFEKILRTGNIGTAFEKESDTPLALRYSLGSHLQLNYTCSDKTFYN